MSGIDLRAVLWRSVVALMTKHYGGENLTRFARDVGVGPGTATRIKEQQTSVGLDVLTKVADFYNVEAWQLLVPGFDPNNPPVLLPVSDTERELWERVLSATRQLTKPSAPPKG